jgi:hypothetical protein
MVEVVIVLVLAAGAGAVAWLATSATDAAHPTSHAGPQLFRACTADTKVVGIAVAALQATHNVRPPSSAAWRRAILTTEYAGGPWLLRWPANPAYTITAAGSGAPRDTGDGLRPVNGDVVLRVRATNLTYDATLRPSRTCAAV